MKKMNAKTKLVLLVSSLLLIVAVGATAAFYITDDNFRNTFRVKSPGVALYELFDPTDRWTPEEEKKKEVMFQNTGEQDMLLRFKIEAEWDADSWPNKTVPEDAKKAEDVVTYYWNIGKDDWVGNDNPDRLPGSSKGNEDRPVDFEKIGDYYYYTKILKAGEPTQMILESVGFTPYLSNDLHGIDYSGKQINISLKGETVLAVEAAANDTWGADGITCEIVPKKDREPNRPEVNWTEKKATDSEQH